MTHESGTLEPDGVRTMFDRIAPVYDVMNHVMTAGLDRRWRRLTVEAVVQPGARVLDACCGTGDLAIAAEREGGIVTGLDFSGEMLVRARRKSSTIVWVQGDVLALPFVDGSFDAATVGFGVDIYTAGAIASGLPIPRLPGWAAALVGDLLWFSILLASSVAASRIFDDDRAVAVVVIVVTLVVPPLARRIFPALR